MIGSDMINFRLSDWIIQIIDSTRNLVDFSREWIFAQFVDTPIVFARLMGFRFKIDRQMIVFNQPTFPKCFVIVKQEEENVEKFEITREVKRVRAVQVMRCYPKPIRNAQLILGGPFLFFSRVVKCWNITHPKFPLSITPIRFTSLRAKKSRNINLMDVQVKSTVCFAQDDGGKKIHEKKRSLSLGWQTVNMATTRKEKQVHREKIC